MRAIRSFAAPGVVSNFVVEAKFTSLVLNWSPPQELYSAVIAYEVSYRSNNQDRITINTTNDSTTFITPELVPFTYVSAISVRAYTTVGPGATIVRPFAIIPLEPVPRE